MVTPGAALALGPVSSDCTVTSVQTFGTGGITGVLPSGGTSAYPAWGDTTPPIGMDDGFYLLANNPDQIDDFGGGLTTNGTTLPTIPAMQPDACWL